MGCSTSTQVQCVPEEEEVFSTEAKARRASKLYRQIQEHHDERLSIDEGEEKHQPSKINEFFFKSRTHLKAKIHDTINDYKYGTAEDPFQKFVLPQGQRFKIYNWLNGIYDEETSRKKNNLALLDMSQSFTASESSMEERRSETSCGSTQIGDVDEPLMVDMNQLLGKEQGAQPKRLRCNTDLEILALYLKSSGVPDNMYSGSKKPQKNLQSGPTTPTGSGSAYSGAETPRHGDLNGMDGAESPLQERLPSKKVTTAQNKYSVSSRKGTDWD